MKGIKTIAIILAILILLITFVYFKIPGIDSKVYDSQLEYTHSLTKAICNETHCRDYEIYCNGEELIKQSPITGAVISIPQNWEDPRNNTLEKGVCD